jgi:hypothetical protein
MLPGSAFEVDLGGPYDVVLLTNFLHYFDKQTYVELLNKVHGALKQDGRAAMPELDPGLATDGGGIHLDDAGNDGRR